tara:strand:+ start:473 stop:1381 length:909 start_codon:yes stop_codon:yes gene_type:complete
MAKVDKSQYTKAQWRLIRDARRREKEERREEKARSKLAKSNPPVEAVIPPQEPTVSSSRTELHQKDMKNYVVCLKHGSKYSSEYVNKLYNMCKRHLTVPFEFVCFTDDLRGIDSNIKTITLKQIGVSGWWYKPMFFDKNFPLDGTLLYMDLDIVICGNIDHLFTYNPDKFCIIRDFNRSLRSDWNRMNSSVFRLKSCSMGYVYDEFMKDHGMNMRRFHGDQDWIYEMVGPRKQDWSFWPDDWILSYKWEMRDRNDLVKLQNQPRNFRDKKDPKLLPRTCIAVFHGEPHPHQCEDNWVKENWK